MGSASVQGWNPAEVGVCYAISGAPRALISADIDNGDVESSLVVFRH